MDAPHTDALAERADLGGRAESRAHRQSAPRTNTKLQRLKKKKSSRGAKWRTEVVSTSLP